MRPLVSTLACAGVAAASGFQGTSPFVFFSTSEVLTPSQPQILASEVLTTVLERELSKCPTDVYVLAHQPGVNADDYTSASESTFTDMRRYLSGDDKRIRSSFSVPQVIGQIDQTHIKKLLQDRCGAGSMHLDARLGLSDMTDEARPRVITFTMNDLPKSGMGRRAAAHVNELYMATMLDTLPTENFTVIYTTTPPDEITDHAVMAGQNGEIGRGEEEEGGFQYEMDHTEGFVHMELRRDTKGDILPQASKDGKHTNGTNAPLFEKYQFFTPALFMSFFVGFMLLSILYVAVTAIAGMEVSYAAFDKDNGPAAQRKS